MPIATFPISACVPFTDAGTANPGDTHLPIGKWDPGTGLTWQSYVLLKASINFAGMSAINDARVYLMAHTASGWHANGSGAVPIVPRRVVADWSEASGGATGTDETWGSANLMSLIGSTMPFTNVDADAANGAAQLVYITELAREWLAGSPNYGVCLAAGGPAAASAFEAYSRRASGLEPYIWIDYSSNTAPNAPTGLTPTGNADTTTGRTIAMSLSHSDPDAGDYMTSYQVNMATDAESAFYDSGAVPFTGGTATHQVTLPAGFDAGGPYYKWRARTWDKAGVPGAFSAWQRFRPDSVPATPTAPTVQTDTLAPTIGGSFSDPDPGTGPGGLKYGHQVVVHMNEPPWTLLWDSGLVVSATFPWTLPYAGPALAWGRPYSSRYRVMDGMGYYGEWGAWAGWVTAEPVGPDNLTPRTTAVKVDSLTPTLTVGHSVSFRNDEVEVYAANDLGSAKLWTKAWDGSDYAATTTKARVYAGAALAWGGTYWWRARVEYSADGTVTAWTPLVAFRVNALPTAPTVNVANTDGTPAVVASGVRVVTVARPVLSCAFTDPDVATDGDTPSARSIEVRRKDTQAALAGYPVTTGTTTTHTLTADLTAEVVYQVRWGWRDAAGQPAGSYTYSPWTEVRRSAAPAIAAVSPGPSVTDSTPAVVWSLTPTAGKLQATSQVTVYDLGPTGSLYPGGEVPVHDSGVRSGTGMSYTIPAGVVLNGHRYRWQVRATDTDGLAVTLV